MTAVLDARVPDLLDDLLRTVPPAPPAGLIAARARSVDISARSGLVLRLIGIATGLWITRHGLLTASPAGADLYGHVVRTDFALDELFPRGRLDGWFPGLGGGYRLFTVNGAGLAVLAGLVRVATLGVVDTARALGLLGALSIAVLPWAVAVLSRELGAGRLAAGLHGLLALSVSFYAGGGLAGLYATGLIAQSVALPLLVVTLALVIRALRHGGGRAAATAAVSVAGLALLHPISVLVLALLAPLGLGRWWWRAPGRGVGRAGVVAAWSVALAGFWLVPALRFRDHQGAATAWAIPPLPTRLAEVLRGEALFPRPVALAAAGALVVTAGWAVVQWQRRRRSTLGRRLVPAAWALVLLTVTYLAAGHQVGPHELRVQFPSRGLAPAAILLLQPLAELLADGVTALRRRVAAVGEGRAALPVLAAAGLALCLPGLLGGPLDPRQEALPPSASLRVAAGELHRSVPPMGRHLLVRPPGAQLGTDEPSRWLADASGTNSAHLYFWEATRENTTGVLAADLLWTIDPVVALDTLRRAGVTHVVTADPVQAARLAGTGGFARDWSQDDVTIFRVTPQPGRPEPGALLQPAAEEARALVLSATPTRREAEHLAWTAAADTDLRVVAAVSYDPAWRARVDGEPVAVARSTDGYVQLDLPAGTHRVDLRFTATRPDPLGVGLTLAGLAGVVAVARVGGGRWHGRRRRPSPEGGVRW